MKKALELAKQAYLIQEVPIGCVIVCEGQIIGSGYNQTEGTQCGFNHAEMLALKEATTKLGTWRLDNCQLYVTLEPCLMCLGAIMQARIGHLFFGAHDPKRLTLAPALSDFSSLVNKSELKDSNHRLMVTSSLLSEDCQTLLKNFFKERRQQT